MNQFTLSAINNMRDDVRNNMQHYSRYVHKRDKLKELICT